VGDPVCGPAVALAAECLLDGLHDGGRPAKEADYDVSRLAWVAGRRPVPDSEQHDRAAESVTSMQTAAPSCPTPRSPYGISFACAQATSAEAISRVAAGVVSDDPPAVGSGATGCPAPRNPWECYACAHRASDTEIGPP
jgi:hypothetical protein